MKKMNTRRLVRVIAVMAIAVTVGALEISPALAVERAPAAGTEVATAAPSGTGWLRVAHLSPDTRAVDVRLTAQGRTPVVFELDDVRYGAVSGYQAIDAGHYRVTMVPAGSAPGAKSVASLAVTVGAGSSSTVAAFGTNEKLRIKAYADELTTPAPGTARIRLLQASTVTPVVSVVTTTGATIARNARIGMMTKYVDVPAGPWTLALGGKTRNFSTKVTLALGSVTTLLVLDTAAGGLTARPVLDSAAAGDTPVGAVQTGGGYLAEHRLAEHRASGHPLDPKAW